MQHLDLNVHHRDEYEGKLVECNGCNYLIGEFLGLGAERVVHRLVNQQSSLSFFVIKILKRPRPPGMYTEIIAKLRADPSTARVVPITLEASVPGGLVELQPNVDSPNSDDPAASDVKDGFAALSGDAPALASARAHFSAALMNNRFHTDALYGIAHVLWRLEQPGEALAQIGEAVQIEPNLLRYRRTHIELAVATQQLGWALHLYFKAEQAFENVYDLNELGIQLLLDAGMPEEALQRASNAVVSDERRIELHRSAEDAVAARQRARALMSEARESVMSKNWKVASDALLSAQGLYNRDPELCMNSAFAAIHGGDPLVCAGWLLHASAIVSEPMASMCVANAGFAFLLADELTQAINTLNLAATRLTILHGAIPDHPADLPGVGIWIEGDQVQEELPSVAARLIEQGLKRADASDVNLSDRVRALAEAYRLAAAAVG